MSSKYAIGIDPGGVTGLAMVGMDEDGVFSLLRYTEVDSRKLGEEAAARHIVDTVLDWWEITEQVDVFVMEDFILRARNMDRSLLSPVRLIAKIETWMYVRADALGMGLIPKFKMQQPSQAKSIATDHRLRGWGLWVPGKQHARDAVKHCVIGLRGL